VFEGGANERSEEALLPPLGVALLPIVMLGAWLYPMR